MKAIYLLILLLFSCISVDEVDNEIKMTIYEIGYYDGAANLMFNHEFNRNQFIQNSISTEYLIKKGF